MKKIRLFSFAILLVCLLNACSKEEIRNVEDVKLTFWEGSEVQLEDVVLEDEKEINLFVQSTNKAQVLDKEKFIKTPPLLTYDIEMEDESLRAFHLWIAEKEEGYIQSLHTEKSVTSKLEEGSIEDLMKLLEEKGEIQFLKEVVFEK
ncbi:hypothetical protein [Guptibacillus hwajinpoensis]|uniref:hypothetical protein n=1 Tax=Guptibacillus hwajinpoensis TaxID=208199 RepID=UPI00384B4730